MKNLLTRTLTGAIFTGSIVGTLLWDAYAFNGLMLLFALIASFEFYRMFQRDGIHPQTVVGLIGCGAAYVMTSAVCLEIASSQVLLLILPFLILIMAVELFRKKEHPALNLSVTALPLFYIAIPMALLGKLFILDAARGSYDPFVVLGYFILIWTGDTMAYLGGMTLGRHKLFERISPKKTWEGSITGAFFAVAMGWFLSLFFKELDAWQWMGMALVVVVAGTFGDLTESLLKRNAGVKDSGNLLPGHGGFLDRFDSVLFSAPLVVIYLYLYKLFL